MRKACDRIAQELDWDTIDVGCLHRTTSVAHTVDGRAVIVGVLTKPGYGQALFADAKQDMTERALSQATPLWIYVPEGFPVPPLPDDLIIRTVLL